MNCLDLGVYYAMYFQPEEMRQGGAEEKNMDEEKEYDGFSRGKHYVDVTIGYLEHIRDGEPKWSSNGGGNYKVTAWKPLPEPYKGEEHE